MKREIEVGAASDLSDGGIRKVNDAYPGGALADEILTPGPRQVKALFVTGGNPLITMPNAGRLRDALASLDLLVTGDTLGMHLAIAAKVWGDVPAGETFSGHPARPHKETLQKQANLSRLPRMQARIKALEATVAELRERLK